MLATLASADTRSSHSSVSPVEASDESAPAEIFSLRRRSTLIEIKPMAECRKYQVTPSDLLRKRAECRNLRGAYARLTRGESRTEIGRVLTDPCHITEIETDGGKRLIPPAAHEHRSRSASPTSPSESEISNSATLVFRIATKISGFESAFSNFESKMRNCFCVRCNLTRYSGNSLRVVSNVKHEREHA